jgi:hypothetical protein
MKKPHQVGQKLTQICSGGVRFAGKKSVSGALICQRGAFPCPSWPDWEYPGGWRDVAAIPPLCSAPVNKKSEELTQSSL